MRSTRTSETSSYSEREEVQRWKSSWIKRRSKKSDGGKLRNELKKRDILVNSANDRVFVVDNAMNEAVNPTIKMQTTILRMAKQQANETVDESSAEHQCGIRRRSV